MRNTSFLSLAGTRLLLLAALSAVLMSATVAAGEDDPPGRVARVNLLDGRGAMQPAGTDDWVDDLQNRPLTGGDKIWVETGSRAEMHIGSTALRLGARTALQVLTIDDRRVRLRLTAGSLSVRIRALDPEEHFEIETPAGEISLLRPGGYRLDVDDRDTRAHLAVWSGRAEARGAAGSRIVHSDEAVELAGDDSALALVAAGATDSLDLWAEDRDHREDESRTARYVSRDVVGYEELDGYGDWVVDPGYGSVWYPQVVVVDWAPYRFGHWAWIGLWGWTWIDDQPWGFAPCHYGRWLHSPRGWGWAPGEREGHRPVFAPALVAWRGDRYPRRQSADEHAPRVGWVPLGYNEIYEPPFRASHNYLRAVNLSNTRLQNSDVDRFIDERQRAGDKRPERRYANERVPGAYTTVSRDTFISARPVGRNRLQAEPEEPRQAPFSARGPDLRPEARSVGRVLPTDRPGVRPDRSVFERPVMSAPPTTQQGERMRERVPMPQRVPDLAPAGRAPLPLDRGEPLDRPLPRQREAVPVDRPQILREDRPVAPPSERRLEREVERTSQTRPMEPEAPRSPVRVERESQPQPRYSPPPDYRAPQRSAPKPESRSAPPPAPAPSAPSAPPAHEREDRRAERGNR